MIATELRVAQSWLSLTALSSNAKLVQTWLRETDRGRESSFLCISLRFSSEVSWDFLLVPNGIWCPSMPQSNEAWTSPVHTWLQHPRGAIALFLFGNSDGCSKQETVRASTVTTAGWVARKSTGVYFGVSWSTPPPAHSPSSDASLCHWQQHSHIAFLLGASHVTVLVSQGELPLISGNRRGALFCLALGPGRCLKESGKTGLAPPPPPPPSRLLSFCLCFRPCTWTSITTAWVTATQWQGLRLHVDRQSEGSSASHLKRNMLKTGWPTDIKKEEAESLQHNCPVNLAPRARYQYPKKIRTQGRGSWYGCPNWALVWPELAMENAKPNVKIFCRASPPF